uniref:Uncharacterized protein n=1 Tax=Strongyloides stercoralis TaxID=6248 RepID=A0AAF5I3H4_STRER
LTHTIVIISTLDPDLQDSRIVELAFDSLPFYVNNPKQLRRKCSQLINLISNQVEIEQENVRKMSNSWSNIKEFDLSKGEPIEPWLTKLRYHLIVENITVPVRQVASSRAKVPEEIDKYLNNFEARDLDTFEKVYDILVQTYDDSTSKQAAQAQLRAFRLNIKEEKFYDIIQLKLIEIIIYNLKIIVFNGDCDTFKNIEMFLKAQQSFALSYSDTNLPGIIEEFLKVIKSGISINDNNNDYIKLQMYANEVDINSHTDEYSECLHVCLIINNSFEEMSKKDSIFTWTVLPTHGVKQLGKLGNILDCRICFILLSSFLNCKTVDDLDLVDKYLCEYTLKLSHGRYDFCKKLHYIFHYLRIIAWNNNSFVGLSTYCYER